MAAFELRAAAHERRIGKLDYIAAVVAGLDCLGWMDPQRYCSLLDVPPRPGQPAAPLRPPEYVARLIAAQDGWRQ